MNSLRYFLSGLLLLLAGSMQAQDSFGDPPEPQVPVFYYPLTVTCDPDVAGTASGRGSYAPETVVTVSLGPERLHVQPLDAERRAHRAARKLQLHHHGRRDGLRGPLQPGPH